MDIPRWLSGMEASMDGSGGAGEDNVRWGRMSMRRRRSYREKYEAFASRPAARLRSEVLGSDVVNGYTTLEQAETIAEALQLGEGDALLDLGGGRGWPGTHVAASAGCRLVVCDLPMNALEAALGVLGASGLRSRASVVRADGRGLPFADASFDGVCHTDVLC